MSQEEITVRVMVEADKFILTDCLVDPTVLQWFPMSNLKEVEDAVKIWLTYARQGAAFTAELNGRAVGMANLYVSSFEKLKDQALFAIVVSEPFRGLGVGRKMLKFLIQHARDNLGMKLLHLEVYEGNPAQRLYERLGFKVYGRHDGFLKEPDGSYHAKILMQLHL